MNKTKKPVYSTELLDIANNDLIELLAIQKILVKEILAIDNTEAVACSIIKNKAIVVGNAINIINSVKISNAKNKLDCANFILNAKHQGLDVQDIDKVYNSDNTVVNNDNR